MQDNRLLNWYFVKIKLNLFHAEVYGHHVGVSVTRLINFNDLPTKTHKPQFTAAEVKRLLTKKLEGINASRLIRMPKI